MKYPHGCECGHLACEHDLKSGYLDKCTVHACKCQVYKTEEPMPLEKPCCRDYGYTKSFLGDLEQIQAPRGSWQMWLESLRAVVKEWMKEHKRTNACDSLPKEVAE